MKKNQSDTTRVPASFRDPSGYVFSKEGVFYRAVCKRYAQNFDLLLSSGLAECLTKDASMVDFQEVEDVYPAGENSSLYKVLKPMQIPFVSYPYEWSFAQLKEAALLTLRIQKKSLDYGMSLKDATPTNVQFFGCKPVFIDTLSFETYVEGTPWVAYRQFCEMFLAPLLLATYCDETLLRVLRVYKNGVPLSVVSRFLPAHTQLSPSLQMHIHMHARMQKKYAGRVDKVQVSRGQVTKYAQYALVDNLQSLIKKLTHPTYDTEWGDYYDNVIYSKRAFQKKQEVVGRFLREEKPKVLWDMGANTGEFSHLPEARNAYVVAFDVDYGAVGKHFLECVKLGKDTVLPLVMNLDNPSPSLGWAHRETMSLRDRGPADMVLALALMHHLAISNHVPFTYMAQYFASICDVLVIEYIPKSDGNVQKLLASREDIFDTYTRESFLEAFTEHFCVEEEVVLEDSGRVLFKMKRSASS